MFSDQYLDHILHSAFLPSLSQYSKGKLAAVGSVHIFSDQYRDHILHSTFLSSLSQYSKGKLAAVGSVHMFSDQYLDKEENAKIMDVIFQWLTTDNVVLNAIDAEDPEVRKNNSTVNRVNRNGGVNRNTHQKCSSDLIFSKVKTHMNSFVHKLFNTFSSSIL